MDLEGCSSGDGNNSISNGTLDSAKTSKKIAFFEENVALSEVLFKVPCFLGHFGM